MAAVAVVALAFEVGGDGGLEQGVVAPGGAVEDGGGVGGGRHGAEILVELVGGDVLGLVGLEEDAGGGADDVGVGAGAEEGPEGLAEAELESLHGVDALAVAGVGEVLSQAFDAGEELGAEGGGALHAGAAAGDVEGEEDLFEPGAELVLPGLARHHDGEGGAAGGADVGQDGAGGLGLVWT